LPLCYLCPINRTQWGRTVTDANPFFDIENINTINLDALVTKLPGKPWWKTVFDDLQGKYVLAFLASDAVLKENGINTALRLAHFLGQGLIETGFLRYAEENLNYSAEALGRVWPSHFPTAAIQQEYARKPEKIANRAYADRMGNGDEASGDGWKYRGRGFIQLTGRNNYERYAEASGVDIVDNPDLLSQDLQASIAVAAAFFRVNNLLQYADENNASAVSRGVNRGNPLSSKAAHGEDDRILWTKEALTLFQNPDEVKPPREGGVLEVGDRGVLVEEYQGLLVGLDYATGGVDGIYGTGTKRMVVAFQQEHDLPTTGKIDQATADAIDEAVSPDLPTPTNRTNADAADIQSEGLETAADSDKVGAAGAVAVGAGAIAIGNEILNSGSDEAGEPDPVAPSPTPQPSTTETPTTGTTEVPVPTPAAQPSDGGINWITIGILVAIIAVGLFVFIRSRKMKKDQVKAYRDGRIV
tara:strand:+ start:6609 stop:8021 length:1413 start_codon:yes stop_codon:yes gene_type:complete